jgi:hypothetical protein
MLAAQIVEGEDKMSYIVSGPGIDVLVGVLVSAALSRPVPLR